MLVERLLLIGALVAAAACATTPTDSTVTSVVDSTQHRPAPQ